MKKALIAASLLVPLAACANPEREAAWRADAGRSVICHSTEECAQMWSRAIDWVQDHSTYRFQLQTDNLIQTAGPDQYSPESAMSVTKRGLGGDDYAIVFRSGCANMFGCIPPSLQLKAEFNDYVLGN